MNDNRLEKIVKEARDKLKSQGWKRTKDFGLVDIARTKEMIDKGAIKVVEGTLMLNHKDHISVIRYITKQSNNCPSTIMQELESL